MSPVPTHYSALLEHGAATVTCVNATGVSATMEASLLVQATLPASPVETGRTQFLLVPHSAARKPILAGPSLA
jgi:hypothetical protein